MNFLNVLRTVPKSMKLQLYCHNSLPTDTITELKEVSAPARHHLSGFNSGKESGGASDPGHRAILSRVLENGVAAYRNYYALNGSFDRELADFWSLSVQQLNLVRSYVKCSFKQSLCRLCYDNWSTTTDSLFCTIRFLDLLLIYYNIFSFLSHDLHFLLCILSSLHNIFCPYYQFFLLRLSLFEILSRSEIPYALCDNCSRRTNVQWLHKKWASLFETTYIYKDLTELRTRDVCIRTELCTCCLC